MKSFLIVFSFVNVFSSIICIYLTDNSSRIERNPAIWTETEIWGPLLEDWIIGNHREKRVMQLSPTENILISEEKPITTENSDPKESKISSSVGKIVSTSNPMRKPTPGRQVSETDLYLLGAIEKLVYRVDFMEKRLRRVEEMLYYVMAGNRVDQEPCPNNFTRINSNCYLFSTAAGREYDWKAASSQCKKFGSVLAEMETIEENQDIITYIQNNHNLRGKDYWTGGLNPGLLWIWSNSARPVPAPGTGTKKNPSAGILGEGRCLRLAYNPSLRSYSYRGSDCSIRYSFICEIQEQTSSNEIRRLGRNRKILNEL